MLDVAKQANLLEIHGVCRSFPKGSGEELLVLEKVDLTIRSGEIVGLLGRSGSGKSTLLRIIAGLIAPSSGDAKCRGETISGPPNGVAMVFQSFALFPWLTVLQNVELGLEALGIESHRAAHPRTRRDRPDRSRRLRVRLPQGTVRRHAPARRLRPRTRRASGPAADGRAVFGARRPDRRDAAHRPDRSLDRRPAADQVGADGDAQHRGGGVDVRPHSGVLLQSRPRRRRDQGRPAASAQPSRPDVPATRRQHLCAHDAACRAENARRSRAFTAPASAWCSTTSPPTCSRA